MDLTLLYQQSFFYNIIKLVLFMIIFFWHNAVNPFFIESRCIHFLMVLSWWWFVIFLICGTAYHSSLSRIILPLYPNFVSSSISCKMFFSSMVSILMRNISLTVLLKSGKLKILRYLNTHYQLYKKYNMPFTELLT